MTPAFLDSMSWRMAEVYGAVTDRILINLAKYFPYVHYDNQLRGSFEWQAKMLAQMGQVRRETIDIIMKSLGGADAALRGALEAAILDALKDEDPKLRKAAEQGLITPPGGAPRPEVTPNQFQAYSHYYQQSADKLNLVNTVMLESTQAAYTGAVSDVAAKINTTQGILNEATGEVVTGVSSYNTAMREAVKRMVDNGLTGFIDHGGHRWSPEAYVAMDIRTTLFNTAREAVWEDNRNWGNDIYQVSTKSPARPLCYPWQGKLLSSTGFVREVPDLDGNMILVHSEEEVESFRYGGGLFGVNCGHYPMAFIPGLSVIRGEPMDEAENEILYEQTQHQRKLERTLREEKRDLAVLRAQGADPEAVAKQKGKVDQARSNLADYCEENDLPRRRAREYTPINATWPET